MCTRIYVFIYISHNDLLESLSHIFLYTPTRLYLLMGLRICIITYLYIYVINYNSNYKGFFMAEGYTYMYLRIYIFKCMYICVFTLQANRII